MLPMSKLFTAIQRKFPEIAIELARPAPPLYHQPTVTARSRSERLHPMESKSARNTIEIRQSTRHILDAGEDRSLTEFPSSQDPGATDLAFHASRYPQPAPLTEDASRGTGTTSNASRQIPLTSHDVVVPHRRLEDRYGRLEASSERRHSPSVPASKESVDEPQQYDIRLPTEYHEQIRGISRHHMRDRRYTTTSSDADVTGGETLGIENVVRDPSQVFKKPINRQPISKPGQIRATPGDEERLDPRTSSRANNATLLMFSRISQASRREAVLPNWQGIISLHHCLGLTDNHIRSLLFSGTRLPGNHFQRGATFPIGMASLSCLGFGEWWLSKKVEAIAGLCKNFSALCRLPRTDFSKTNQYLRWTRCRQTWC
jgi:hypothetical protein